MCHSFCNYVSVEGHQGGFQVGAVTNKAAINIHGQVFVKTEMSKNSVADHA